MLAGIDYGSKLAGTTSICFQTSGKIAFVSSKKGADADEMILNFSQQHKPSTLFLDAPLSLPLIYSRQLSGEPSGADDYFYRSCDKELKAMSPMFLGGLTARAMRLAHMLRGNGVAVFETYPKWHAQRLGLVIMGYKKEATCLERCTLEIADRFELNLVRVPASWHEFDALLALLTGFRYVSKEHLEVGDANEGLIYL